MHFTSNHRIQGSKSKFGLTEQVFVEYAVEVEVSAHGAAVVREVVAEVALKVIFHVAENVGLEVPEDKTIEHNINATKEFNMSPMIQDTKESIQRCSQKQVGRPRFSDSYATLVPRTWFWERSENTVELE